MKRIEVIARAVAKPGKETEVRALLLGMLAPTRKEEGCEFYDLFESHEPGRFYFYEMWDTREALERHAATPHYAHLKSATKDVLAVPIEINLVHNIGIEPRS